MTDPLVFGESRGGRFLVTQQGTGGVSEPTFCRACQVHRTRNPLELCPCCEGGAA